MISLEKIYDLTRKVDDLTMKVDDLTIKKIANLTTKASVTRFRPSLDRSGDRAASQAERGISFLGMYVRCHSFFF